MEKSLSFGYWVRRRRKSLDLTQVELARQVACTESLIRKIESDQRRPSRQMAEALAEALQISAQESPLFLQIARAEQSLEQLADLTADAQRGQAHISAHHSGTRPLQLPADTTPFIGRAKDLADIQHRLLDPACRLLTLVGPGGIGKSRLAVQAARLLAQHHPASFRAGLFYVPLESVTTTAGIITAIADVVALRFYDNLPPKSQLLDYLRTKDILLLLDNFEHLQESLDLLSDILQAAPGCKMLVISRIAVKLYESWFHPVDGLMLPQNGEQAASSAAQMESDAVQLFMEAARRTLVDFPRADLPAVVRICQLVDGMPLGIELAAAWLKAIPLGEIVAELEQSLDLLTAQHENFPDRQRSIKAVIESSWRRLQVAECDALMQLSLCRNGFRRNAAVSIAEASLTTLATLVEHSLLRLLPNGRYAIHEMIRQFALEQLRQSGREAEARRQHATYYLQLLVDEEGHLTGAGQQDALEKLDIERENLRMAWLWSVEQQDWMLLDQGVDGIYNLYHIRSLYHEGADLFSLALQNLTFDSSQPSVAIRARLLARYGSFCFALGDNRTATDALDQSFSFVSQEDAAKERAFIRAIQGQLAGWHGERLRARHYLEESLALYEAEHDRPGVANVEHKLAQLACSYGEYALGRELAEKSLLLCEEIGRPDWCAYAFDVLGWATLCLGEYAEAENHYRRSLDLFEQSGDRLGVALALGGIGSVMWAMGEATLAEGKRYMEESLAFCREIGHRQHVASRLWYLAQFANELKDFQTAQAQAEAGLALAHAINSRIFAAYSLCALGETMCAVNDLPAAYRFLNQAIELAAKDNQLPPLLIGLIRMAEVWIKESEQSVYDESSRQMQRHRARNLLLFVQQHPACWMPYQQRIEATLEQLPSISQADLIENHTGSTSLLEEWTAQVLADSAAKMLDL
jgi:predicted ATPase/transcriptional regulator with XRE-family HTH domain